MSVSTLEGRHWCAPRSYQLALCCSLAHDYLNPYTTKQYTITAATLK